MCSRIALQPVTILWRPEQNNKNICTSKKIVFRITFTSLLYCSDSINNLNNRSALLGTTPSNIGAGNDNLCFPSLGACNANTNDLQADGESHLIGILWTIQMMFHPGSLCWTDSYYDPGFFW